MNECTVHLLGPVRVDWGSGTPPRFRSQRTMALLGYLAAEGRPVARGALAALFWPDATASKGKANLRRELHNLGNVLPSCWRADRKTVQFGPGDGAQVDVYELLRLEEAEQWVDAGELIRGDFLEGVSLDDNLEFETWLSGERERWRQRAERVLSEAVRAQEESGDHDEALRFARRLLQLLPWHEETHRKVMRLLALSGQRSAALKQFKLCRQVLRDELGVEVSAESRALYERIRDSLTFALHNIPASTTPLIGREEELALLERWLLDGDTRLITLTGAGGMGKTRLALGLAQELLERPGHSFRDGVYFVNLASLGDPAHLVSEIAAVLHFPLRSRDERSPRRQLLDYLRGKQMLLILDNFEHLLAGAEVIASILDAAPGVQILATSRERLGVRGEQVLPLHGLIYDDEAARPETARGQSAAAQLFLSVAERVQPGFSLRDEEEFQLSRICRLVEGMPLGLELAATWVDALALASIAHEIKHSLSFLETEIAGIPERHRSIEAVFDTSWQRLSPQERQIFLALSVFRGGFTREEAEVVAGASVTALSRLVNRSLIRYQRERGRYEMHELLRQYAASLFTPAQREVVQGRHLDYFARLAERVQAWRDGPGEEANLERLEKEAGNFRTALAWSLQDPVRAAKGLRLAAELEWYWKLGADYEEGAKWLARLLAATDSDIEPAVRAHALKVAGDLEIPRSGMREKALVLFQESLSIQETFADQQLRVATLSSLGHMEIHCGTTNEARTYLQEAWLQTQALGDVWTPSTLTLFVGLTQVALRGQDLKAARSYCERGLGLAKELGADFQVRSFLELMSWVAAEERDWPQSRQYLEEAMVLHRKAGDRGGLGSIHRFLGELARCEEQYEVAEVHYQQSLKRYRELGDLPSGVAGDLFNLGQTYLRLSRHKEATDCFAESLDLGHQFDNQRVVANALEGFANAASAQNQSLRAARLWAVSKELLRATRGYLDLPDRLAHEHFVDLAKEQIDRRTFDAAWTEGEAMTVEEAVDYALAGLESRA